MFFFVFYFFVFERFKAAECSYKDFIFHETFVTIRGKNYSRR